MEDTYGFVVDFDAVRGQGLFAVFDGHGNYRAADWCGTQFHKVFLLIILDSVFSFTTQPRSTSSIYYGLVLLILSLMS